MTVLLNCSTSWCQNDNNISSTGDVEQNYSSVLVPISALRIANAKMIELKYEKEINNNLKEIIHNDSIIINTLEENIEIEENKSKRYKKQRNIAGGVSIGTIILVVVLSLL